MKHSKGPWSKDADGFVWSPDSTDYEICHVPRDVDAKLISAAPEMLEVLKELVLNQNYICPNQEDYVKDFCRLIAKARRAINKAEGDL